MSSTEQLDRLVEAARDYMIADMIADLGVDYVIASESEKELVDVEELKELLKTTVDNYYNKRTEEWNKANGYVE